MELNDKFPHDLGNIMQVINSSSEMIKMGINSQMLNQEDLQLIIGKDKEAAKQIKDIRKL
ncbi:MAG: hypothetical protein ACTSRH_03695 [Promethearchaeota archaeon]